ncbi:hypothetical protein E4Q23_12740 [Candidatus Accumulibacter phosphatis]|uniref:Lipocalin-like domain-containing protein n=1 Tax=Candidatus Accumulibacter phosphatis TaxID=327160 RepID=A0ABX1TWH5_9PROT|nr:hypothetical protein [Candidatus Accumulibacter phosphatis]NMQ28546.1 hypothetical protein [Candidatus Accumulibacter phosphatis]
MRFPPASCKHHCARSIALLGVLLVTACGQPATPPATKVSAASTEGTVAADEKQGFTGDWTTIGTRQVLDLGPGQQAVIFQLQTS